MGIKKDDWTWICCSLLQNTLLVEMMMEALITEEQLIGMEPMPERLVYRRLLYVMGGEQGEPGKIKVSFKKLTTQNSQECTGMIKTSDFLTIGIADPEIVIGARKCYGEKAVLAARESDLRRI